MCQEILANSEGIVTKKLISWFGLDKLRRVERLSPNIFRARLTDGGVGIAMILDDGSIAIRELEEAC